MAYFCNNPFLNQLGLSPNFTLIRSMLDARKEENKIINLMDDKQAVDNVRRYLQATGADTSRPLSRNIIFGDKENRLNVVVVLMESMSAAKMRRNGNLNNLTPFLDSIANEGYYFNNAYSSGIHTFNGIFSSLFSFPAIFRQNPLQESMMYKYHGIAATLKENNYSTIYFTSHDGHFDNVEGFLKENDFERVVSEKDYPAGIAKTTLGVPDDFMFEYSIPLLSDLNNKNKPFLAVFMTASDHGPYYIPEYFKPKSNEVKKQIVEYADYSLQKFIRLSSQEKWFENTLFVFIADHGAPMSATYDLSLDYNHVPLLFYAPHFIKEKRCFDDMAGQIDVFPSVMGLLKIPYINNTLGINLFKEKRPYIYFNADDKYGVIDGSWLLIEGGDVAEELYRYRNSDLKNYARTNAEIVAKMRLYAESNLQTFQHVLKYRKM